MLDIIHRFFNCRYGRHEWVYNGTCVRQRSTDDVAMEWSEYSCEYCGEVKHGEKHPYYYKSGVK